MVESVVFYESFWGDPALSPTTKSFDRWPMCHRAKWLNWNYYPKKQDIQVSRNQQGRIADRIPNLCYAQRL